MQFRNHIPHLSRDLGRGGGVQWKFAFPNGYGASVINDGYGRDSGLYELAVLDAAGSITYDTPLTDDVLGYLTVDDVADHLDALERMTADSLREAVEAKAAEVRADRIAKLRAELAQLEAEVSA